MSYLPAILFGRDVIQTQTTARVNRGHPREAKDRHATQRRVTTLETAVNRLSVR